MGLSLCSWSRQTSGTRRSIVSEVWRLRLRREKGRQPPSPFPFRPSSPFPPDLLWFGVYYPTATASPTVHSRKLPGSRWILRYNVSRSTGSRPVSSINCLMRSTVSISGVVAPAS